MDALTKKLLPEAQKDIREAKMRLADKKWMAGASDYSKNWARETAVKSVEVLAAEKAQYLALRAKSGWDNPAMMHYTELMNPKKANAYKTWTGWVIARMLVDDDGKEKPFTFYPGEFYGKPPYFYATKEQAERALAKVGESHSNAIVVRYSPRMYLNRY